MVSLALACASASPVATPAPVAPPAETTCALLLRTEAQPVSPREQRLVVTAQNVTKEHLRFRLPDRCPNGLIAFEGLSPDYDYYGTCNAGACPGERPSHAIELAPGERRQLATAAIHLEGKQPCTQPLAPGSYTVRAVPPEIDRRVCSVEAVLEVTPAPVAVMPPPAPRPSPAPAPPVPEKYRCEQSSDCTLSCPTPKGCCTSPCGCKHAINRRFAAEYEAEFARTCDRPPHCPAYGCRYEPAFGAMCVNNRCVPMMDPAF